MERYKFLKQDGPKLGLQMSPYYLAVVPSGARLTGPIHIGEPGIQKECPQRKLGRSYKSASRVFRAQLGQLTGCFGFRGAIDCEAAPCQF
jgi:hypothetical protein